MKTYKHLFEKLIDEDNIKLAIHNAAKNKKGRRLVKNILNDINHYIKHFQNYANNFAYVPHEPKEIYDGISRKKRVILVPTFHEQVMHHMIVNILKPIFMKSMYTHSYGSIPLRGAHKAKKYIQKWLKNDPENTKYCLKLDVKKYFDNVSTDILKNKLRRIITDKEFISLLDKIIDIKAKGIPIGFYTSQWFANFFLTDLDHCIKENLHAKYYVRYMNDMVVFSNNKEELHYIKDEIEKYLQNNLQLELKENWQIFPISEDTHGGRPLNFMGFKFYRHKTTLRKNILLRARRIAKRISTKLITTNYDCRRFLSYIGWLQSAAVYQFYLKYIKPYIKIGYLKRLISNYDRRKKLCGTM